MGNYNEFLYDDIGNEYVRKNQYLLELARHQNTLKSVSASDKEKVVRAISVLTKNKKNHPYNVELSAYKKAERNFLVTLNAKVKLYASELDKSLDSKLRRFEVDLYKSREKASFYKSYIVLSYDAELEYERNRIIMEQLPEIIEKYRITKAELLKAQDHLTKIDMSKEATVKADLSAFKAKQLDLFKIAKSKLKEKRKDKQISEKALRNGIVELKNKRRSEERRVG